MAGGRKTKYHASYARQAEVACREGGFTDAKLAKLFDVSKATINTWKHAHPIFLDSIKRGKEGFDTEEVEKSLLKRAKGFTTTEVTKEPGVDPETLVVTKTVKKLIVPDTTAQIFWLINRNRDKWTRTGVIVGDGDAANAQPVKVEIVVEDARKSE